MSWIMFAYKYESERTGTYYMHFGPIQYVRLHHLSEPIVEVEISENRDGNYWGWLKNDDCLQLGLIWPSEGQFEMCFPYGSAAEEERGDGKKVRLSVKEIYNEGTHE